jgi:Methyltransferase domain
MSSCCNQGFESMFGEKTAARDLERYRRRGPSKPTRALLDALRDKGIQGASVLDIGGGIGAIPLELLDTGAAAATGVDAAPAYLSAAVEEAKRRGHGDRVAYREGDFVAIAPDVPAADVVTLDRVICCYPDMEALVGLSAERALRLYGLVYPRDAWWIRAAFRLMNLGLRLSRKPFRVYVHRPEAVDRQASLRGLTRRLRRSVGPMWLVALYERVST